jgi:ABC-2 type transport system permease protein
MSAIGNIIKKEIKELLTPATFIPIIIIAAIYGSMGSSIQGIQQEAAAPPVIGIINEDNSSLSRVVDSVLEANAKVVFNSTSASDVELGLKTLNEKQGTALIVIDKNFTSRINNQESGNLEIYWIMKGAGVLDSISSSGVEFLLSVINTNISEQLIFCHRLKKSKLLIIKIKCSKASHLILL